MRNQSYEGEVEGGRNISFVFSPTVNRSKPAVPLPVGMITIRAVLVDIVDNIVHPPYAQETGPSHSPVVKALHQK